MRPRLIAVVLATAVLGLSACSSGSGPAAQGEAGVRISAPPSTGPYRGLAPEPPVDKPQFVLTDTAGQPYDLAAKTRGKVTLLYFGYTHCPDICPTTMADVSVALTKVAPEVRDAVTVVFVTTDPQRDTGPAIRSWLDEFDSSFVGLTGTPDQITTAAQAAGVPLEAAEPAADGTYAVQHGTQLYGFSKEGPAPVLWLAGAGIADLTHDLPVLVAA